MIPKPTKTARPEPPRLPPTPDPKHDPAHIRRFCAGIEALLGGPLDNNDAQDLGAIAVRMSAHDRDRLLAILTSNAEE